VDIQIGARIPLSKAIAKPKGRFGLHRKLLPEVVTLENPWNRRAKNLKRGIFGNTQTRKMHPVGE